MITNKARTLSIDYTPLKTSVSVEIVGSVAGRQTYNGVNKMYTPDYSLVPLILFPRCSAADPDKTAPGRLVNAELTNMAWYDVTEGRRINISGSPDYSIVTEGSRKGELTIKKNSSVVKPLSLEFKADFVDKRTGQVFKFRGTHTVIVTDETAATAELFIDSPVTLPWNPIRDKSEQTITARMIAGKQDLTSEAGTKFQWYRKLSDGSLEEINDGNGDDDWEIVAVDKNVLTIDREFIGDFQTYVCRAHYNAKGTQENVSDKDPMAMTTIVRRLPDMECDWKGVTFGVPGGQNYIRPVAFVRDKIGNIANPEEWLKFVWMTKAPGGGDFTQAAVGMEPTITMVDGMILDLRVEDKGPQALIVDDSNDNIYITDKSGDPTYQRLKQ